jgi:hypothetical protein
VTTNNTTENEPVDYKKFIRKFGLAEYFFVGSQVLLYGWVAGIFFDLFLGLSGPPFESVAANPDTFYAISFIFPIILFLVLLRRNSFLTHINKKNAGGYLEFGRIWRILIPVSAGFTILFYVTYAVQFHAIKFYVLPFVLFFIFAVIFQIFDKPLTNEGEIYISFDMVMKNIQNGNFNKLQANWKGLANKIEHQLKNGEIYLSRKEIVYFFSVKILQTNDDLTNDLECIRNWLLGNQRSCYEALTHIIPKEKFGKNSPNWFVKNPERTIRYVLAGFLSIILLILVFVSSDITLKTSLLVIIGILLGIDVKDYLEK